jgi:S1-C subfamily serine protease
MPSVVSVLDAGGREAAQTEPPGAATGPSLGAGFVVDTQGHVVTNGHVVGEAKKVSVRLAGGEHLEASVVGRDEQTDLALLRVHSGAASLRPMPLGDSDRIAVGDWVLAVGSPYGLEQTLTAGIISAKGRRDLIDDAGYWDFIQTDAAINPGNSGGPLIDLSGRVIGIATAMRSDARGIGFAVPVNTLRAVLPDLIRSGRVSRSWIGIFIDAVPEEVSARIGARGAVVSRVVEGGPAALAGLRKGEVVLAVNGRSVARSDELPWLVSTVPLGKVVTLRVWRDGTEHDLRMTTIEKPRDAP